MSSSTRHRRLHLGLSEKEKDRLEYVVKYRRLKSTLNVLLLVLLAALFVEFDVYFAYPVITAAIGIPIVLFFLYICARITFFSCPWCGRRLGWRPFYKTRCRCNELIDLHW